MDRVQEDVKNVFEGKSVPINFADVVATQSAKEFEPMITENITYVAATVLMDGGKILMIQEADPGCYEQWYLPAARIRTDENIVDAAKRGVKEESGLECEIKSLFSIEFASGMWWRFNFTGQVTGGQLKKFTEDDPRSLQARWLAPEIIRNPDFPLRAPDMLQILDSALHYKKRMESDNLPPCVLPIASPHRYLLHRMVIFAVSPTIEPYLLINSSNGYHIPSVAIDPNDCFIHESVRNLLVTVFAAADRQKARFCGCLSVEHCGIPRNTHDGLCLTSLIKISVGEKGRVPQIENRSFVWCAVSDPKILQEVSKRLPESRNLPVVNLQSTS